MSEKSSLAIIICTEPGRLEGQSLLLAESIRTFAGDLKDMLIYSFHPRRGDPVSLKTIEQFEELNVIHQQIPINIKYHDYYLANKPLVCAYAENNIDVDILVFLDSDKCVVAQPDEFLLPSSCNVRMHPEYGKGSIGSTGDQDPQDEYWQKLYKLLGVQHEIFINTPIANKRIRGYWNSGLVSVRRSAGIFSQWKDNFEKVMSQKLEPSQGNYFVEQSVLSATLCSLYPEISHFSDSYSYPLPLHNRLHKSSQVNRFDELISVHYFNLFFYKDWQKTLSTLKNIDMSSAKYQWICEKIVEYDMPYKSNLHRYMLTIRRIEERMQKFNLNFNLSGLLERIADS